jgi:hypothetical protein
MKNSFMAIIQLFRFAIQVIYSLCIAIPVAIILFLITSGFYKIKKTVKKLSYIYWFFLFKIKSRFNLNNRPKVDKRVKNSFTISKQIYDK